MKTTHTFATLEVSAAAYDEIMDKLVAAGYHHALVDGAFDMHGIRLLRATPSGAPAPHSGGGKAD